MPVRVWWRRGGVRTPRRGTTPASTGWCGGWRHGRSPVRVSVPAGGWGSRGSSPGGRGPRCGSPPEVSGSSPVGTMWCCPGWGGSRRMSPRGSWPAAWRVTARILSVTLSRDSAGGWFVSFQTIVQRVTGVPAQVGACRHPVVGVDVGVTADALLVVATPGGVGPYDPATRVRREPSKRWWRTQGRIGRTHARAAAVRCDVLYKATTELAQRHQVISVETLNASGMRSGGGAYKRGLNRALADAALAQVRRMLGYKTRWYGSALVEAGRYYPSSKTCSACGRRKPNLTLADRRYVCEHCGLMIDRDLNAAINLARLGEALHMGGTRTGTGSRPAANQTSNNRVGDGRGATQETATTPVVNAAGPEASTRHDTTAGVHQTGTAPPEGEAA